jgi:hypothetical protein
VRRLVRAWEKALANYTPGDEYDLVDTFADILRLQGWYEWAEDRLAAEDTFPQGNTNPELLKEKQPAAVMYCLSALRRFDDVEDDPVCQIVTEIALLFRWRFAKITSPASSVATSLARWTAMLPSCTSSRIVTNGRLSSRC